ncbi:MAG: FxsA family protein [Alphaproteobacteria bacterium]|nr:FxsA family protein [Alphaproteobacteria bacterium]
MPGIILLAFILVPIAEIAVFIKAGQIIGLGWTLAVIVLTALIGTALLRQQGLRVLRQTQERLDRGEMPVGELFDGLCLLVAGALLLTPGFITDAIGFLLFIPPFRQWLGHLVLRRFVRSPHTRVWVNGAEVRRGGPADGGRGPVIDGEFTEVPDDDAAKDPRRSGDHSPWRRLS